MTQLFCEMKVMAIWQVQVQDFDVSFLFFVTTSCGYLIRLVSWGF